MRPFCYNPDGTFTSSISNNRPWELIEKLGIIITIRANVSYAMNK